MFDFWTGAEDLPIYGFLVRATIIYTYVFLLVKILGQRSMGTISPIDFIFGVVIGDVIGEPLSSGDLPLAGPLAAASMIGFFHLALSYIALKTPRFRRVIEDEPLILMKDGKIMHKELTKAKVTIDSLLMDLRLQSASDFNEIDYAVLEANGQISVIKKSEFQSITPNDMNKSTNPKGYPTILIEDGRIIHANVKKVGSLQWLSNQMKKLGITDHKDVFLLSMDEGGQFYYSMKERY
ncbi:DUF421 domain-containing protein [Evansella sp. AB-rgal1]|uniref:DUF421 domain-containing protein n=1 Tax=Evansella sp. AB-rgal1 TaxID=3242696 RepID=UPI00359F092B